MRFLMFINVKIPTIVNILTLISWEFESKKNLDFSAI